MRTGLTIIELLLVVAIFSILAAFSAPYVTNSLSRNYETTVTESLVSAIRSAQNYNMTKKNNTVWGICLISSTIRVYRGTCASPAHKEDTQVPSSVVISGLNDTTFSLLRGEPSSPLSITITSPSGTSTVSVNAVGGITIL